VRGLPSHLIVSEGRFQTFIQSRALPAAAKVPHRKRAAEKDWDRVDNCGVFELERKKTDRRGKGSGTYVITERSVHATTSHQERKRFKGKKDFSAGSQSTEKKRVGPTTGRSFFRGCRSGLVRKKKITGIHWILRASGVRVY